MVLRSLLIFSFFTTLLFADLNTTTSSELNASLIEQNFQKQKELEKIKKEKEKNRLAVTKYLVELKNLEQQISKESVWMKSYYSYLSSMEVRDRLLKIRDRIKKLKSGKYVTNDDELESLIAKEKILATQVNSLKERGGALFSKLLTPPKIGEIPTITNPIEIFKGVSLIKTFDTYIDDYMQRKEKLKDLISLMKKEKDIYDKIIKIDSSEKFKKLRERKIKQLERFEIAFDTIKVTADVYKKRLDVIEASINKQIEEQIQRLSKIGITIFVVVLIFFLLRLAVRKYITDNDRFYMANKIITFTNFIVIALILFFSYIENVSYLVTILGFASAGIAIAMKDWFMSILGWLVIVFGGSIHVGDRIRVDMDGMKYVGDVMDISLLRMTILEDITLTSVMQNRRAGRIIFVPNNYIFTRMIANYTHSSLKTVWDGIKITITFDSNHKKAMHIVKTITRKYSKGYTDITRKQLNKLRNNYNLKNTNVEPRIYSFISHSGLDIEAWYLTNAYGTLTLRSTISTEIVDAFNAEDDITIAYTTQKLNISMSSEKTAIHDHEMV